MPRILEAKRVWTITGTTGGAKAYNPSPMASYFSCYFVSSSDCTATMQMQTAVGSSAGPWVNLGASTAISTGAAALHQFNGPLEWVRPYCTAISSVSDVVTVTLIAN